MDFVVICYFANFEATNHFINTVSLIFEDNIQDFFIHEKKIRTTIAIRTAAYFTN
jgi:hypothetical protein